MKKLLLVFMCCSLIAWPLSVSQIYAEPGYSDTEYWNDKCTGKAQMTSEEKEACLGYSKYLQSQNEGLGERLNEIDAKREEIAKDIEYYSNQIKEYQNQIDAKQVEINDKQGEIDQKQVEINSKQADIDNKQLEIDAKQLEIDDVQSSIDAKQLEIEAKQDEIEAKQVEIDETQADIDTLNEKIADRLVISQSTMRINKYLEILMGVSSFEDFMRIANALNDISQYDNKTMNDMVDLKALLNEQKEEMKAAEEELKEIQEQMVAVQNQMKAVQAEMQMVQNEMVQERTILEGIQQEIENEKQVLTNEQGTIISLQYETQVIEEEILKQEAELMAMHAQIAYDIASKNAVMQEIAAAGTLDTIAIQGSTAGWVNPVPNGRRSAGTWFYPGGGLHLGYDFAAPAGSPIYSPGPGVVLYSSNGCPTYGYLGNYCRGYEGGAYGGGNQVFLLCVINDGLYAIQMHHMMLDTPIASGTVVGAGTQVGLVGSSGNSSGPHLHFEVFYLGAGSNFSNYAQTWNGDLNFGASAGYDGYYGRCEAGNGPPCRIRPEDIYGY